MKNYSEIPMTYNLNSYTYNGLIVPFEVWKPITNEMVPNIKPIYLISNLGNVYNTKKNSYSNITIIPGNYVQVSLRTLDNRQVSINIHRLVCMAFNGMPHDDYVEVDHINCDKTCNYESNLEWVSKNENHNRACINNLIKIGEDNYRAILTNNEVEEICELLSKGTPIPDICRLMENKIYPRVYPSGFEGLIYHLLRKDVWIDISSKYNFPKYENAHTNFSIDEIEIICQCLEQRMRYIDILKYLNRYSPNENINGLKNTIYEIKAGKIFTEISSKYNIVNNKSYILTNEEIDFICKSLASGVRPCDVLKEMGEKGKDKKVKKAIYDISRGVCHKKELNYYKSLL